MLKPSPWALHELTLRWGSQTPSYLHVVQISLLCQPESDEIFKKALNMEYVSCSQAIKKNQANKQTKTAKAESQVLLASDSLCNSAFLQAPLLADQVAEEQV